MKQKDAENIALRAFGWLSSEPEIIGGFLGMSGANVEELRDGAQNPEFLGFVLEFVLSQDEYVLRCAEDIEARPEDILMARAVLPGGDAPNWTYHDQGHFIR